jgi:CheY-like chemotaxis protein
MKEKLNCILLIDDDEPTNFLNELVIKQVDCAEKTVAVQSGQAALDFLKERINGGYPQPELIFLDINMPVMNGWEFLEEYKKLDSDQKAKMVMVMLTVSLNPDAKDKADTIDAIDDFVNKPLTAEIINEILNKHFADRL